MSEEQDEATGQEPEPQGQEPTDEEPSEELDDEALRSELDRARREAAKYRTERNEHREQVETLQEQMQGIASALGLAEDEETPPVDRLADELSQTRQRATELEARVREMTLNRAVEQVARREGAAPELTWAVLHSSGELANIDLDADDLESQVSERVQAALEANPQLRTAPLGRSRPQERLRPGAEQDNETRPDMNELLRQAVRGG